MPSTELTPEEIADGWSPHDWFLVTKTRVDGELVEIEKWRVGFERRLTTEERESLFPEATSPMMLGEFVGLVQQRVPHVAILRQRQREVVED